jgi:hypothetical protein
VVAVQVALSPNDTFFSKFSPKTSPALYVAARMWVQKVRVYPGSLDTDTPTPPFDYLLPISVE